MNKNNDPDQSLDQLLAAADRQLWNPAATPAGFDIRRRAQRRRESRRLQRQAVVAATVLLGLLFAWRWVKPMPTPLAQEINTRELQAEIADLRQTRQRVDQQLAMLDLDRRLQRMESEIQRLQQNQPPIVNTYQRNLITWNALEQITSMAAGTNPVSSRWQLETLAVGYSDTTAGMLAQTMLDSNQTPDSFFRELQ